jgi:hypothetical protein
MEGDLRVDRDITQKAELTTGDFRRVLDRQEIDGVIVHLPSEDGREPRA